MIPNYINYFIEEENYITPQGYEVKIVELRPEKEDEALTEWAMHLQSHYSSKADLLEIAELTGLEKNVVLSSLIFPDPADSWGRSTMVGDFAEILIADYLQYVRNYVVPRTRYEHKDKRNRSTQGSDLLAYKMSDISKRNLSDQLLVYEVKAQSSEKKAKSPKLQEAIIDSAKDVTRLAESIVASGRRLVATGNLEDAKIVFRFLNNTDTPYKTNYGGAAVHSNTSFSKDLLANIDVSLHPDKDLELIVVHCDQLLSFILNMFERATKC